MKRILSTIFSVALMILFQSCATQPIFYHSEASLPYFHSSTKTVFQLIKDDNAANTFQFGVISAKDNDTLSYVLLAPAKQSQFVSDLTDVNLSYAIPLLPAQVKEFIKILNSSAEKWDAKFDVKDGISYEFMVSPENRIIPQSENVVVWYSTFKFYFQNNDDGPLGTVLFGEGLLQYFYRLEKASEIRDLSSMLSLAIKK
ncbi:MAG: hypothetical protein N3D80_06965 [Ignavibacterium album]|uniref:hypothetical protein n=1 Tax=Ignavibacterium album TaxID=591197 RepID=UPI0026EFA856|nr:hypothetical protein [Ignavibacterium album]MCX8105592.1 hypothetical protein [Ignavibacterium album]